MSKQSSSFVGLVLALGLAACGGPGKKAETAATPEPVEPATPAKPAAPTIGPDECCCPFASAEAVAYNIMKKADCDAAGTGCVENDRCLGDAP